MRISDDWVLRLKQDIYTTLFQTFGTFQQWGWRENEEPDDKKESCEMLSFRQSTAIAVTLQ